MTPFFNWIYFYNYLLRQPDWTLPANWVWNLPEINQMPGHAFAGSFETGVRKIRSLLDPKPPQVLFAMSELKRMRKARAT